MRVTASCALVAISLVAAAGGAAGQQVADTAFAPALGPPTFADGNGPVIAIDEAHHNFHTASGRYLPFAELARRDGYRVRALDVPFTADALRELDVLVIANALHARNERDWTLPTPSAFTSEEIAAVRAWVDGGGSLLLIADHMPMAGAAEALGDAFGIAWNNGFAIDPGDQSSPFRFTRDAGTLGDHVITRGTDATSAVTSVATFTGSAFQVTGGGVPLLTLPPQIVSLMPQEAWQFSDDTKREAVGGWLQGAALERGKGRVAAFGEAAMFTAQLAGPNKVPMGMNAPVASQNPLFLLNVLHWLTRTP